VLRPADCQQEPGSRIPGVYLTSAWTPPAPPFCRAGLLMIIFLGETIVGLAVVPIQNTGIQYAAIGLAAIVIWGLHVSTCE